MKEYNYIYQQLVTSEHDIYGIIAYSVYKRQKIQHIIDFKQRHKREPTTQELQPFNTLSCSSVQLEFYENEALALTESFLSNVLEGDLKEYEANFQQRIHDEVRHLKPNHLIDIGKGALGSLLFVILTGVLYFAIWSISEASLKPVIEHIFNIQIISTSPSK